MGCLDENLVAALLDGRLSAEGIADIDEHVARCTDCHGLLTELARVDLGERATEKSTPSTVDAPGNGTPPEDGALGAYLALAHAQRRIGSVLQEKWTIDRVIGCGGMAQVYAATHRNGKQVAIKILRPELCAAASLLPRFLREGYVANKVGHPSAVSVLDDGVTEDGAAFMVMELLVGETLRERLSRVGRLPVGEVLSFAEEILDVLAAAHAKGIIHRDIKPENIFLPETGGIKVLDFGIARMRELTRENGMTESGVMMGTPAYMPPEQARGRWDLVDARSDLWAVGATMFTLLSGRPVRDAKSTNEELLQAMTEPVRSLASVMPELSSAVVKVVDRALHVDRERRFPDATSMQEAIRDVDAVGAASPGSRSRVTGSRARLFALGAAASAIGLAFVGVRLTAVREPATTAPPSPSPAAEIAKVPIAVASAPIEATKAAPPLVSSSASAPRMPPRAQPKLPVPSASASAQIPPAPPVPSASAGREVMDRRH